MVNEYSYGRRSRRTLVPRVGKVRSARTSGNLIVQNEKEMIGRRVSQLLEQQGIRPQEAAKKWGISSSTMSHLEQGQPLWLHDDDLRKLALGLGLANGRITRGRPPYEFIMALTHEDLVTLFLPEAPDQLKLDL